MVDTSVWIECFTHSDLGQAIAPTLSNRECCIVPTIVQLELGKWALRELTDEQQELLEQSLENCRVELLDSETAALAAKANRAHKLATADAVIYATAQRLGACVVTCDAHFEGLPSVIFYPKPMKPRLPTDAPSRWEGWPKSGQFDHPPRLM